MELLTWNVNGLRACITKGFLDVLRDKQPDVLCIQEHKLSPGQLTLDLPGYEQYWCYAQKKGYSGTAVFTKQKPLNVTYELEQEEFRGEGRVITAEFETFYLVNVYTPNSQQELARLPYRLQWDAAFRAYLCALQEKKPVLICGDLNVAHKPIDLKNPKANENNAGYSAQERQSFTELLNAGFFDSFRALYPEATGAYTWWSYLYNSRSRNAGWRLDYFLLSQVLRSNLKECTIYSDIFGSDHCPYGIKIDV